MAATAPQAPVDICNLALDHLNQAPITSIDTPTSNTESLCARWYHAVRRAVLRKHPWNFASYRAQIARNATAPAFGYANAYDLPTDFIRLLTIGDDYTLDLKKKYKLEGRQILSSDSTDTTALNIRYIKDYEDVTKMDPLFVDVLAAEIALRIAKKVTGDDDMVNHVKELLKQIAPESYAIDGQEDPPIKIERSRILGRRRRDAGTSTGGGYYTVME